MSSHAGVQLPAPAATSQQVSSGAETGTEGTPADSHPKSRTPPLDGDHYRPASPGAYERGHFRKKRKTLACYECRRRKLKCDREYPACSRCVKTGHPGQCVYEDTASDAGDRRDSALPPNGTEASRQPHSSLVANGGHQRAPSPASRLQDGFIEQVSLTVAKQQATIAQLQNKIASLEAKVIGMQYHDFSNMRAPKMEANMGDTFADNIEQDPAKEAYHEVEHFHIRGKGYKTKFYGASDSQVLLLQFSQLQEYIKTSVVTNPRLQEIQNRSRYIRRSVKEGQSRPIYSGANLARLVPRREIADLLVDLYLKTFAMIYPIIHKPSFMRLYEQFWNDHSSVSDDYLAKLILAMASVRTCIYHPSESVSFLAYKSSLKLQAEVWVDEVEAWLEQRSQKHVIRSDFQVKCLLVVARVTCILKSKRAFTEAGTLIRSGMSAGLHRNTAVRSKQLSAFDMELRQRIWAFMKIWDLQACIERGMPIWAGELGADDTPPLNIHDSEFDKVSESLPPSRPRDEFTDASFIRITQELFALRSGITILVNTARSYVDYNEVLSYDAKITEKIHDLPKWIDETTTEEERQRRALPQYLLEESLRQCQIMLHRPFMRIATTNPRYSYSRTVCLETAAAILEKLHGLPDPIRDVAIAMGPGFYRATFSVCQSLYVSSLVRTDALFNATRESLSALVLQTIGALEEKVMKSGNGIDQHWLLQAAYFFNRTRKSPERAQEHLQSMIDRVALMHSTVVGTQDTNLAGNAASSAASVVVSTPRFEDSNSDNLGLFDFLQFSSLTPDMLEWDGISMPVSGAVTSEGMQPKYMGTS